MRLVTCKKDGWVSMAITKEWAQDEVDRFNTWFIMQSKSVQDMYGGKPSSINSYTCLLCGGNKFKKYDANTDANIDGHTINSVVCDELALVPEQADDSQDSANKPHSNSD